MKMKAKKRICESSNREMTLCLQGKINLKKSRYLIRNASGGHKKATQHFSSA
jgi:hypothetical protein